VPFRGMQCPARKWVDRTAKTSARKPWLARTFSARDQTIGIAKFSVGVFVVDLHFPA
jgi:hypothetical protein